MTFNKLQRENDRKDRNRYRLKNKKQE